MTDCNSIPICCAQERLSFAERASGTELECKLATAHDLGEHQS